MKRNSILLFTSLIIVSFVSCSDKKIKYSDFKCFQPDANDGREYFYSIEYDNFDFYRANDFALNNSKLIIPGACTSCRSGDFHGRNLDFFINDSCQIFLRLKGNSKRYESIGIVDCIPRLTKKMVDEHSPELFDKNDDFMNFIPLNIVDGINEKGVCININVCPKGICEPLTETNPGKQKIAVTSLSRYVLDNASSVDEAVKLIKEANVCDPAGFPAEFHLMISDLNKTVVVEFWDNKTVVTEANAMTNFYVCNPDTELGMGRERFDIVSKGLSGIKTQEDMLENMKRVYFSQAYLLDTDPYWYSDLVVDIEHGSYKDIRSGNFKIFEETKQMSYKDYVSLVEQKKRRDGKNWMTTHTCSYDLRNKSMLVTIQETDMVYKFKL